ncbi:hypothetical protein T492DRAFT_859757 [Pavlovales sp. CCMP2436]|nr:hypothetical protein T492DRAFT_859757 [Pavlovales sp. CCMP2436]
MFAGLGRGLFGRSAPVAAPVLARSAPAAESPLSPLSLRRSSLSREASPARPPALSPGRSSLPSSMVSPLRSSPRRSSLSASPLRAASPLRSPRLEALRPRSPSAGSSPLRTSLAPETQRTPPAEEPVDVRRTYEAVNAQFSNVIDRPTDLPEGPWESFEHARASLQQWASIKGFKLVKYGELRTATTKAGGKGYLYCSFSKATSSLSTGLDWNCAEWPRARDDSGRVPIAEKGYGARGYGAQAARSGCRSGLRTFRCALFDAVIVDAVAATLAETTPAETTLAETTGNAAATQRQCSVPRNAPRNAPQRAAHRQRITPRRAAATQRSARAAPQ